MASFWWIRKDVCGLVSASLTVFLILYAQVVIVTVVLYPWQGFNYHFYLYSFCSIMSLVSHCRAQFSNPGAVPLLSPPKMLPDKQPTVGPKVCRHCTTLKPPTSHHCSTCGRCVVKMDHHCPWVNNCVAIFNQKYFLLFLFWTAMCCFYSGVLLVGRFWSCTSSNPRMCTISGWQAAACVANMIEAIIFGLFVCIMMWDQLSAIFENTPGIDSRQGKKGVQQSWYVSLQGVFGEPFGWRWFFPLEMSPRIHHDFNQLCSADPDLAELLSPESMSEPAPVTKKTHKKAAHVLKASNEVIPQHVLRTIEETKDKNQ